MRGKKRKVIHGCRKLQKLKGFRRSESHHGQAKRAALHIPIRDSLSLSSSQSSFSFSIHPTLLTWLPSCTVSHYHFSHTTL